MGYFTNYILEVIGEYDEDELVNKLIELIGEEYKTEIYYMFNGYGWNAIWDKHSTDMKKISKSFPELKFALVGNGEDNGDLWVEYFKNGKSDYQKAVLPAYDENRLK